MVNNNYPVDIPKTYTVSYFNENEWNKDLTSEEIAKNNEIAELQYQDNLLNGSQVGPGNEQSKTAAKEIGGVALTTLTIICPPAGLTVGVGVATVGAVVAVAANEDGDSEAMQDGFDMIAIGMGSVVGGASGSSSHKGYVCSNPICPKK